MHCITSLLVKSNHKSREEVSETTAWLFETRKDNNSNLAAEVERLGKTFVLNEAFSQQLKELEAELSSQENVVEDALKDSSETQKLILL